MTSTATSCAVESEISVARGNVQRLDKVARFANARPQHTKKPRKPDSHSRNGSSLNNEEERPTVQKSQSRRERLTQINILPARLRHHSRQLAIRQRRSNGKHSSNNPGQQQPSRTTKLPRHISRHNEDSRPNHPASDNHGAVKQAEPAAETARAGVVCLLIGWSFGIGRRNVPPAAGETG